MRVDAPRLVVTGPGGWIGTALLDALPRLWGADWAARVSLFGSSARTLEAPNGERLEVKALDTISAADTNGALVAHLAFLTKDKLGTLGAAAFFAGNQSIDAAVLRACRQGPPRGLFVASSGAAAQAQTGQGRELYGLCKLMQEDAFLTLGRDSGAPVLVGRIFNIAGPFINKVDAYAVSNLLRQAMSRGEVEVEATTPVYRAYLHVGDLCALILGALGKALGADAPIDLGGALTTEMEDVAREALRAVGAPLDAIRRAPVDWSRPSLYLGDPTGARTLALRLGMRLRSFAEQVDDTAAYLRRRPAVSG